MQPEHGQPHFELAHDLALGFARSDLKRAAHYLDKGQKGCLPAVRRTASRQDEGLLLADALAEFVQQARLAHAGLGHDVDHAQLAAGFGETTFKNFHFALAPDIGGKAAPYGRLEPRRALTDGVEPIDLLRLRLALDRVSAGESRLDQSLHEALRGLAQVHGSRLGEGLQARGEVHRVAERRHRGAFAANLRDHREPRINADAHLGQHAVLGRNRGRGGSEAFVNEQPGAAGA